MCPLWPVHILIMYAMVLCPLWLVSFGVVGAAAQAVSNCDVTFEPERVQKLKTGDNQVVEMVYNKTELNEAASRNGLGPIVEFVYYTEDFNIASVSPQRISFDDIAVIEDGNSLNNVSFNVTGNFLGYTKICAKAVDANNKSELMKCIDVSVIREPRAIDKAFTYSVATLVTIIYVNMGAALDMRTIQDTIKRPVGPAIGFLTQFLIMPLLSYGLAKLLIPVAALQLGLFITGCSPGGGASNIWTLTLGGNLDLSITMTTISTFSAFAMMPLWMLTLGSTLFADANIVVPYAKIATFAAALVVPLAVGVCLQFKCPNIAKFLVRILKPFAILLIVFIIVFAVYTNVYLFQLFTWQILLSGVLLPWLGYFLGGGTAWLLKQDWRDVIAIGIETGVQNTGLAIFALRFSLPQPEADLTTALPVAVAMMTPVVPAAIMIYQKFQGKQYAMKKEERKDPLFVEDPGNRSQNPPNNPTSLSYGSFTPIKENSSCEISKNTS